jgi:hypothetical protein
MSSKASASAALRASRDAARALRGLPSAKKDDVLKRLAAGLKRDATRILRANARDLAALDASATPAFRDRLKLDSRRLDGIVEGVGGADGEIFSGRFIFAALAFAIGADAQDGNDEGGQENQEGRHEQGVLDQHRHERGRGLRHENACNLD